MRDILLKAFHSLPGPVRSVAASMRGLYLRSWRYGPETDRLVEEALERETWTPDRWKTWQEERLAYVLHRAATEVPYYRAQWAARRRGGDKASWEHLENWPILEKESVRENPRAFVADDCDVRKMFREQTSGTTGKPMTLWWSLKTVRGWYALAEARWRRWHGVSRHDRWLMLGGQLVIPASQTKPPFWVWNQGLNQLYMSTYHLSPQLSKYYLDAIARYRPAYMMGYSSAMAALAQTVLESRRQDLRLTVATSNAEPLYDYQRSAITEAFQCPVRETYGMGEIVVHASECTGGRLHLWPEVGWVEIMDDGRIFADDRSGELVCTGLFNADMPFIRYRVGDRAKLQNGSSNCGCGRSLPEISRIEGRSNDVLIAPDGRRVYWINPVFYGLPVREAQIIQEESHRLRVRYVPATGWTHETKCSIIDRIRARMGAVEVGMEQVDAIPREVNGKFRAVVSKISTRNDIGRHVRNI
ncbi:MAG: AMP-binding protein [Nitrospira sp.]|nr:AMP-binding protein [Nitrospira sp.]